jgi:hypothetical protein
MKRLKQTKPKHAVGKLTNGRNKQLNYARAANAWNPDLDSYRELRALTFPSSDEIDAAIDLLWSGPLRDMPHELAGGDTIIVPMDAVGYFKAANLTFSEDDVLSTRDLPANELNALRREQGTY